MSKKLVGIVGCVAVVGLAVIMYFVMSLSYHNKEVDLRTAIEAKQKDNTSEMDNMWKTISQVAQVTDAQKQALMDIFQGYAQARTGGGKSGSLATWVQESVPSVDTSTFNNLQNIITSKRDGWTMRQKELMDFKREHDRLLDRPVSGFFLAGKKKIDVVIVTSTRTGEAFKSGKDDDTDVFKKK